MSDSSPLKLLAELPNHLDINPATVAIGAPFFKLPAELRNSIYRYIVVSDDPVYIAPTSIKRHTRLLQTCNQIRGEASRIFCEENVFCIAPAFRWYHVAVAWTASIGQDKARAVSCLMLRLVIPSGHIHSADDAVAGRGFFTWDEIRYIRDPYKRDAENMAMAVVEMIKLGLPESCIDFSIPTRLEVVEGTGGWMMVEETHDSYYSTLADGLRLSSIPSG